MHRACNRCLRTSYTVDIQVVSLIHILLLGWPWRWLLVEPCGFSPSFLSACLGSLASAAWHLALGGTPRRCYGCTSTSQKWTWGWWWSAVPTGRKRRRAGKGGDLSLVPYAKNLLPEETVKTQTPVTWECMGRTWLG